MSRYVVYPEFGLGSKARVENDNHLDLILAIKRALDLSPIETCLVCRFEYISPDSAIRAALSKAIDLLAHIRGSEIPGREPKSKVIAELKEALEVKGFYEAG